MLLSTLGTESGGYDRGDGRCTDDPVGAVAADRPKATPRSLHQGRRIAA